MNKNFLFSGFMVVFMLFASSSVQAFFGDDAVISKGSYDKLLDKIDISDSDIKTYKKIFEAIRNGDIEEADDLSEDVDNKILMGHVEAEKYLSPKYSATYEELQTWLEKYNDHPQAKKLYALAVKKGDREGLFNPYVGGNGQRFYTPYSWYNEDYESLRPKDGVYLRKKVTEFRKYLNTGKTAKAKAILQDGTFKKKIPNANYDDMSATLAFVYFIDNQDKLAIEFSAKPIQRSKISTAMWANGLANWRLKNYKKAAESFGKLAKVQNGDEWLVSAGAFWAYRSELKLEKDDEAYKWLKIAAKYQRTFHGIIATHILGRSLNCEWTPKTYYNDFSGSKYQDEALASDAMKRALVLLKAKNPLFAEQEIKNASAEMTSAQQEFALYIANQNEMYLLAFHLSKLLQSADKSVYYDAVSYPNPGWEPRGGWKLEKALVYAFVRQESAFCPYAKSGAGAKGLMQIMPNTAYHVTKKKSSRKDSVLLNVEKNLDIGQDYISYLLKKDFVDGNLFFLAVCYNAGPGNFVKWQKKMKYNEDPLLFIETVPARETRIYIKRVMANYWIYASRFAIEDWTLGQVSKSKWPKI